MRECAKCNQKISTQAKFCKFCGVQVEEMLLASRSTRFLNNFLDSIFGSFLAGVFIGIFDVFFDLQLTGDETSAFIFVGLPLYYILTEFFAGQTLAKALTRTRVVDKTGKKITIGQALGRTIIRYIPLDAVSFVFSQRPIGWHDAWSNTRVVQE